MADNIDIILEFDDKKYTIPVLPGEVTISSPTGNESAETIALGEITILKKRKLKTLSIESFLPARSGLPFCRTNDEFKKPKFYIDGFLKAQEQQIPVRLSITGCGIPSFWCSIEDFSYTRSQTSDINYSLGLREYRPYGQKAKQMEKVDPLFDWEESEDTVAESFGQVRQPTSFAIGDRVVVTGQYFSSPDGGIVPASAPVNFMMDPFTESAAILWASRKDIVSVEPLNQRRCIICDVERERVKYYDLPAVADQPIPTILDYPYMVADLETRKAIGWVSEAQMVRL